VVFETMLDADRVTAHARDGLWRDLTITDLLDDAAERHPDKLAFVDSRAAITFAELRRQVDRAAAGLLEFGVLPGDVVSFQLPNRIEWIVVHLAVTRLGAVSNPLIPIYREREIRYMVGFAESTVVIVPQRFRGFDYPEMIAKLRPQWPALRHVLVVDGDDAPGFHAWETFMSTPWEARHGRDELALLRPDPNAVTLLIFTSGTTGEPKGVMHTHNTVVAAVDALPPRLGLDAHSVIHMASTLGHLTGFLYGAHLPIHLGATGVLQDIWDAACFVQLVERHRITYTSAATPFLHDLVNTPALTGHDVSSLRMFCCMGAPIPRAIVRRARAVLPGLLVLGGWGQTEDALVTLGVPGDPDEKIIDTDGFPWPGMHIRVVDDDGAPRPAGTVGNLQVHGPFLFVGYARRLDATRGLFDESWFDTGDLASIDADGYLRIAGRTKDVIVRGGENIPVAYLEDVLHEYPGVTAAAVVAIPDPRLQERACACLTVEPGTDMSLELLRRFLSGKGVAKSYWPERVEVLDELPRTPSGKIQKYRLRELIGGCP
jgi:cyclohexanecarboxylate-CoA ligase